MNAQLGRLMSVWLAQVFGLAAAYYILGRLALLLAIPPGYATAIWPAAGIALAGVLLFGYRVWPGIVLGSFWVNVWTSFDATTAVAVLKSLSLATGIGLGAALQALVGAFLVRRGVGFPNTLERKGDIAKFLIFGGPVSCLVGATVGVTTLLFGGVIPWANYPFSWGTWWVGDTIGVLIVTPLVLIWMAEPRQVWRRRRLSITVPNSLALTFAVVFFVYASAWERDRIQLAFKQQVATLANAVEDALNHELEILSATEWFFTSSPEVDRRAFHLFVQRALSRYPGMRAIEWIPRVPDEQRDAYEAAARRDGSANFTITEQQAQGQMVRAARRAEYFPVYYVEPYDGNEVALGFDVASQPNRFGALMRARDSGQPTVTSRLTLVQETGDQYGVQVFQPIYHNRRPLETVEQRRQALQGYVLGVLRIGDMVESALKDLTRENMVMGLYDETAPAGERLLYGSASGVHRSPDRWFDAEEGGPTWLKWATTIPIAGRRWSLRFFATPDYFMAHRSQEAWVVLAGGLLFTSLLGAFLLVVTGRSMAELHQEIKERQQTEEELRRAVAELARSNSDLARFAYVASHDLQEPLRAVAGCVQLLQESYHDKLDAAANELITHAVDGVHHIYTLIDALLAYVQVSSRGRSPEATDCAVILKGVLANLSVAIQDSGAVIMHDPLPTLLADPIQLAQVFQNLLSNALKFRGERPPAIHIGVKHREEKWVFAVRDNGIGIEPRYFERIFGIFQRLHTRRTYPGTGIGLAICKKIVERHGGRMWVASTPGQGATFFFTLPDREVSSDGP
jgi:signal transduction histidine kinase/integral membrane sensor domain MASE1